MNDEGVLEHHRDLLDHDVSQRDQVMSVSVAHGESCTTHNTTFARRAMEG